MRAFCVHIGNRHLCEVGHQYEIGNDNMDDDFPDRPMRKLAEGDADAYAALWEAYGPRLRALAQSKLPREMRQRFAAEDIVQSACRTFFRRMQGGDFQLRDAEDLWRLLCAITINKARMQVRHHRRKRRAVNRETSLANSDSGERADHIELEGASLLPVDLAVYAEQFTLVLEKLDEDERKVVLWKLEESTNQEISQRLHCSDRTVGRMVGRIREKLVGHLKDSWIGPD